MKKRMYDKEFKLNAIKLYKSGIGWNKVCEDLGIPTSTFSGWVTNYEKAGSKAFPGSGNIKDDNSELYRLKKEYSKMKIERDILKKALAIFSKQRK